MVTERALCLIVVATAALCAGGEEWQYCQDDSCTDSIQYSFEHADPGPDYNKRGISEAKAGNLQKALEFFMAASLHSPFRGDVWANIGLASKNLALGGSDKAKPLLKLAAAALELGHYLKNAPSKGMMQDTEAAFKDMYPGECIAAGDCKRFKLERKAMELEEAGRHLEAVNSLCKPMSNLNVRFTPKEHRRGLPSAHSARRIFIILRVCGVVKLEKVFGEKIITAVQEQQAVDFSAFDRTQLEQVKKQDGAREATNAAERSNDRWEVKFPLKPPYTNPDFYANRFVLNAAKLLLTDRIEIDTFSHVTSYPNAPYQEWHGDVGYLFSRTVLKEENHLPPQGVVVVAPLVDLTPVTGPTEFMTGSHMNMGIDYWTTKDATPETPLWKIPAEVGDAVIFDLRIRHRGTPNKSSNLRPIVYLSYVCDWYSDKVNFKDKQTAAFDSLPDTAKKLFIRQDTNHYVTVLEEIAEKHGVDLSALQSQGKYKKVDLKA